MRDDFKVESGAAVKPRLNAPVQTYRYEIVNVLMRRQDYQSLRKLGGPRPDQISLALRHYLKLIAETKWRPEMNSLEQGELRLATFQCPVSKELWREIRDLGGRADSHTVEAMRLWLLPSTQQKVQSTSRDRR